MKTENTTPISGFADTFLSKLKEQSFVILLMIGVIYYQHILMEERVAYWQKQYEGKEVFLNTTIKEDRDSMLDRIKYLQEQRDKYVEESLNELKDK
jgi:hypothetical protein